jgi:hypothetical protein
VSLPGLGSDHIPDSLLKSSGIDEKEMSQRTVTGPGWCRVGSSNVSPNIVRHDKQPAILSTTGVIHNRATVTNKKNYLLDRDGTGRHRAFLEYPEKATHDLLIDSMGGDYQRDRTTHWSRFK